LSYTSESRRQAGMRFRGPAHAAEEFYSGDIQSRSGRRHRPNPHNPARHPAVSNAFPPWWTAQTQMHPSRETGTGSPRLQHCQAQFIPTLEAAQRLPWRYLGSTPERMGFGRFHRRLHSRPPRWKTPFLRPEWVASVQDAVQ